MRPLCKWSIDFNTFSAVLLVVALMLTAGFGNAAYAAPPAPKSKMATALITAAQKEFDAGNFLRAGQLFVDIWKSDATQTVALYNAARAFHLGGNLDKAAELYRQLLAAGGLEPNVVQKVEGFLANIQERRAENKAEAAAGAENAGNYALAAELWGDASRMLPAKSAWLLRSGRAYHLAGNKVAALAAYEKWLGQAAPDAPERADAERWRTELAGPVAQPTPKPAVAAEPPKVAPVPNAAPEPVTIAAAPERPWPAFATLGLGAATFLTGAAVLTMAFLDDGTLQDKLATNSGGKITAITHEAATTEASRIETQYTIGWALTGVGLVGAGVGTWMLLKHQDVALSVTPGPQSIQVAVRF